MACASGFVICKRTRESDGAEVPIVPPHGLGFMSKWDGRSLINKKGGEVGTKETDNDFKETLIRTNSIAGSTKRDASDICPPATGLTSRSYCEP